MTGKHIEVFLGEGVPGGITTAEIAGWTGHIPFGSPSAAAAVALGRSSNGRREWKCDDGTSYGDWENRGVE